ncbi:hypothetical protein AGMMS50212_01700 [Spirochaetia bacterium]|nr:hypothetical protein AGMMS50212_01700 [Spirochaetia bacterium]
MNLTDTDLAYNIGELSEILAKTTDQKLIDGFFTDMFTSAERKDIAARWALLKALKEKVPQRKIAQKLGISLCKITRGSKELHKPNSTLAKMLPTTP